MGVVGYDHVAITVADMDATLAFYARVLSAEVIGLEAYRAGRMPVVGLIIGAHRMNVHAAAAPADLRARRPTPGSGDLCFRWAGGVDSAVAHLRAEGVEIELGPVPRRASDRRMGQSVYFRDPDDNLLEFLAPDDGVG